MKAKNTLGRFVWIMSLVVTLWSPLSALAEDVVHLKDGGSVRGSLMEVIPNQYVNIRLLDGTSRRIDWASVERVQEGPAAIPAPPGSAQAGPVPAPIVLTQPQQVSSPEDAARREALRAEIARLEIERSELRTGGPVAMMIVGGASFLLVLPMGLGIWAASAACDDFVSGSGDVIDDCSDSGLQATGIILTTVGVVGSVVGVVGFVQLVGVGSDRREINDQINIRQQQLNSLSYNVNLGPQRATLSLSLQF